MRVLVCGDRDWSNYEAILHRLEELPATSVVIHGGCRGADWLAERAATSLGISSIVFFADWGKHGLAAGPIRNREMLDTDPSLVIAFHSDLGASKGTKDCVTEAKRRDVPVEVIQ